MTQTLTLVGILMHWSISHSPLSDSAALMATTTELLFSRLLLFCFTDQWSLQPLRVSLPCSISPLMMIWDFINSDGGRDFLNHSSICFRKSPLCFWASHLADEISEISGTGEVSHSGNAINFGRDLTENAGFKLDTGKDYMFPHCPPENLAFPSHSCDHKTKPHKCYK